MILREYLRVLRKGLALILIFTALGLAAALAYTFMTAKVYEATAQVFVATRSGVDPSQLEQGSTFVQDRVESYTSIATSPAVVTGVINALNLRVSSQNLAQRISADTPANTVLINLHVADSDPVHAKELANAVATQFDRVVQQTDQTVAGKPVVKLTLIQPAITPNTPTKPNARLDIPLGVIVGLLIGVAAAIVRDKLDNTVKGPQDVAPLGVPVLGTVPFDKTANRSGLSVRDDPHGAPAEAYRRVRMGLKFVNVGATPRIIAVTSPVPGDGRSTTALNLAAALGEAGQRVCLVDADLRRPSVADAFDLPDEMGLTSVLIGEVPVEAALREVGRNLVVLTSGPLPPNPSELLGSEQARDAIAAIGDMFDYVIVDSAPLLSVADGGEVAALTHGTLLVLRVGRTTRDQAARAVEALSTLGAPPVGLVLTTVDRHHGRPEEYGYSDRPARHRVRDESVREDADEPPDRGRVSEPATR